MHEFFKEEAINSSTNRRISPLLFFFFFLLPSALLLTCSRSLEAWPQSKRAPEKWWLEQRDTSREIFLEENVSKNEDRRREIMLAMWRGNVIVRKGTFFPLLPSLIPKYYSASSCFPANEVNKASGTVSQFRMPPRFCFLKNVEQPSRISRNFR